MHTAPHLPNLNICSNHTLINYTIKVTNLDVAVGTAHISIPPKYSNNTILT